MTTLRSAASHFVELPFTTDSFLGIFLTLVVAVIHLHALARSLELRVAMGDVPPTRL